mgnify:FL=1
MLRFGTIGSGWICDEYIHGAKDSGLWELTAVYSRTKERAEEYARRHGAKYAFTNLEEMAASDCIDAVYISSPNALHYEHSKAFLERGKHVICEKPLCAQASKVRELQRIAQEHGAVFLEAIMYLHLPQRKLLEDTLQQLGQISLVKLDFCQRSSKLDRYLQGELPNIFNPALETGALMDLGVYCVYPALALFGKPESFSLQPHMMESGADGAGIATLQYPDKLVTLTYSKLGQAGANSDFQGTEGTLSVESISRLAGFSLWRKDGTKEVLYGDDEKYKLMGWEAKDFFRYITEPDASATEYARCSELALQVSELMEAMRDQAGILFASDRR